MKKKLIIGIVIGIFAGKAFSLGLFEFGYHVTYKLVSDPYVWQLTGLDDYENERLRDYYADDTLFVCINNDFYHTMHGADIKQNLMPGHFSYEVYTKHKNLKYEIKKITIHTYDGDYDLKENVYQYYPKDDVYIVPFEPLKDKENYFRSAYFVGWFKIPCPKKDKKYSIIVDLTYEYDDVKKNKTFKYDFEVKKGFSFMEYIGP